LPHSMDSLKATKRFHYNPWSCGWLWNLDLACFFGLPGTLNDTTVVKRSPLMSMIALGDTPPVHFQAKVCTYNFGYFYPKWQTFMKPGVRPSGKKQIQFHNA
jgi:hypothetical protein